MQNLLTSCQICLILLSLTITITIHTDTVKKTTILLTDAQLPTRIIQMLSTAVFRLKMLRMAFAHVYYA